MTVNVKIMSNNLKWGFGLAAAGLVVFFYLKNEKYKSNKELVIAHLGATYGKNQRHTTFVNSATKSYINAWADAIRKGQDTFVDPAKGTTHWTEGGTTKI